MIKVFIDGSAGTTGLKVRKRLSERKDLELIILPDNLRKDTGAVAAALDECDIAFLCLPDEASRQAVSLLSDPGTVLIDTSTAFRVDEDWTYGFPELKGQREKIKSSKRIANPGCHASGFISLVAPLTECGIVSPDLKISCFSVTGYSGGGKKMIADYENPDRDSLLDAPRMYGISQEHKHLPEMVKMTGLSFSPTFCPVAGAFYSGMEVVVSLFADDIKGTASDIAGVYADYYTPCGVVKFKPNSDENGFMSAGKFSGRDDMEITVTGNEERIILVSRFDNLGKGASGAAIQNMNIVMGADEKTGLVC